MSHPLSGIKSARLKAGINPHVLAEAIGVGVRSYYRYEEGRRRIYFDKACVLADTLGISLDQLRSDPDAAASAPADIVVNLARDADVDAAAEVLGPGWEL